MYELLVRFASMDDWQRHSQVVNSIPNVLVAVAALDNIGHKSYKHENLANYDMQTTRPKIEGSKIRAVALSVPPNPNYCYHN